MDAGLFDRFLAISSTTEFVVTGEAGQIEAANAAFVRHTGVGSGAVIGRSLYELLTAADASLVESWLTAGPPPADPVRLNFVPVDGVPYTLRCVVAREGARLSVVGEPETGRERDAAVELMRLNNELATMARERARRQRELERTQRELKDALERLQNSYWHLQKIQEVLPLCMRCGKVKTDEAQWQTLVDYLKENEIFLSHGYCPGCAKVVFREWGLEEADQE